MTHLTPRWLPICGYSNYKISDTGLVASDKSGKWVPLKLILGSHGYFSVTLRKDNKSNVLLVHRLVANAFIPKVENKSIINHIDSNKTNNNYSNLEWCDYSHNLKHAYSTTRVTKKGVDSKRFGSRLTYKTSKLIIDTEYGIFYDNVGEAALAKGLHRETLRKYLENKRLNKTSYLYA